MADIARQEWVITWQAAHQAVAAAVASAEEMGIAINVAVCDGAGRLAAFLRMPGAFLASIDIAIDKARTAAGFGLSTARLGALLDNEMLKLGIATRPGVAAFAGGLPVHDAEGRLIGGIGVSGGSEEQDEACARAGLEALLGNGA